MGYGLPHPMARPDEQKLVGRAVVMLGTGDLNPIEHTYPALLMYVQAAVLLAYAKLGQIFGRYGGIKDFLTDANVVHPGLHYRICRIISIAFALATVVATYFLALRADGRRAVALLAALVVATNYLHARDSRWGTVDVTMTFFVTLSLLFAVQASDTQRFRDYKLAGAFAGLAAATKYNAGIVLLAALVGAGLAAWKRDARALVLVTFVVLMFASMATVRWVFPRYLVPFVPPMAVLAAQAAGAFVDLTRPALGAAAALLLAGPGL